MCYINPTWFRLQELRQSQTCLIQCCWMRTYSGQFIPTWWIPVSMRHGHQWQTSHKINILQCLWHMFHIRKNCACHQNLGYVANTSQFCAWHSTRYPKCVSRMLKWEQFGMWNVDTCKERRWHYVMTRTLCEENMEDNYLAMKCDCGRLHWEWDHMPAEQHQKPAACASLGTHNHGETWKGGMALSKGEPNAVRDNPV